MITKARKLQDQKFEGLPEGENIKVRHSDRTIYVFDDGSEAYILTKFEKCEPYVAASTITSSLRKVQYWRAL